MSLEKQYDSIPLEGNLNDFAESITFFKVDETIQEPLWDHLVRSYHYLGYENMIGCRVKYLIYLGKRLIGAISFCSGFFKLGPRDKYVGWDEKTRLSYLPHLINNNRFLILPWVKIHNLASHILSLIIQKLRIDWKIQYNVEPYMIETFVDSEKYRGTCYIASNWTYLGVTKGFRKQGKSFVYHGNRKNIFVKVISRRFTHLFKPSIERLPNIKKEVLALITATPLYYDGILENFGINNLAQDEFNTLLADHLEPYIKYLNRKELLPHFVAVIKGLLSQNIKRKSMESIAIAFLGVDNIRNFNNFYSRSNFDDFGMLDELQKEVGNFFFHQEAMITGDGCDYHKNGNSYVGVSCQYCGESGKIENCQASVMIGYASSLGFGLAGRCIYIPEKWFDDDYAEKRKKCLVPEDLKYATKNELLLRLIENAVSSGNLKAKYVGVDCSFGKDHNFLDSLPKNLIYFADVPSNQLVFKNRPNFTTLEYCGKERKPLPTESFHPYSVNSFSLDQDYPWNDIVIGSSIQGPIIVKDKCIKVVELRNDMPGKDIWLYIRKLDDDSVKFSLCNANMDFCPSKMRILATMRWSIEQCIRDCKQKLGMGQYEVLKLVAWNRHILFVFIAYLFIAKLRRQYSTNIDNPGPFPFVKLPVTLEEYRKAVKQTCRGFSIQKSKH
jgi:SRSO17 transposase